MSTDDNSGTMRKPLALIAGPTASGKSALALSFADALAAQGRRGVIVNADSAQVYLSLIHISEPRDS